MASSPPRRLSESTVGIVEGPVCGSTATIGAPWWTSTTVGVTSIAPSISVPLSRLR